jgi:hypothetical protein
MTWRLPDVHESHTDGQVALRRCGAKYARVARWLSVGGNCAALPGTRKIGAVSKVGEAQARDDIDLDTTGSSDRGADAMRMRWANDSPVVRLRVCRDPPKRVRGRCWLQPGR